MLSATDVSSFCSGDLLEISASATTDATAATEALVTGSDSALQRTVEMADDLQQFLSELAVFQGSVMSIAAILDGRAVNVSQSLRSAVGTAVPAITRIVPALDALAHAAELVGEQRTATSRLPGHSAELSAVTGALNPADADSYDWLHGRIVEQLGKLQTVVDTVAALAARGGIDLHSMKVTLTSLMRSLVPAAKERILTDGQLAGRRLQQSLASRVDGILARLDTALAVANADSEAVASVASAAPTIGGARTAAVASVTDLASPTTSRVAAGDLEYTIAQMNALASQVSGSVFDLISVLGKPDSQLLNAQNAVGVAAGAEVERHASYTMSQGLTGVAQLISDALDEAVDETHDSLTQRLENLDAEWLAAVSTSATELMYPSADVFTPTSASVWQRGVEDISRQLVDESNVLAASMTPRVVDVLANGALPQIPYLGADFEAQLRQKIVADIGRRVHHRQQVVQWGSVVELVQGYARKDVREERLAEIDQSFASQSRDFGSHGIATIVDGVSRAVAAIRREEISLGGLSEEVLQAREQLLAMLEPLQQLQIMFVDSTGSMPWSERLLSGGLDAASIVDLTNVALEQVSVVLAADNPVVDRYLPFGMAGIRERIGVSGMRASFAALSIHRKMTNVTAKFIAGTVVLDLAELLAAIKRCYDPEQDRGCRWPAFTKIERIDTTLEELFAKITNKAWTDSRLFDRRLDKTLDVTMRDFGAILDGWGQNIMLEFRSALRSTDADMAEFFSEMEAEAGVLSTFLASSDRCLQRFRDAIPRGYNRLAEYDAAQQAVEAARRVLHSVTHGTSVPAYAARDLLAAAENADRVTGSEVYPLLGGGCVDFFDALHEVVWPSIIQAERAFRRAYSPLARWHTHNVMKDLVNLANTGVPLPVLTNALLEASAEQKYAAEYFQWTGQAFGAGWEQRHKCTLHNLGLTLQEQKYTMWETYRNLSDLRAAQRPFGFYRQSVLQLWYGRDHWDGVRKEPDDPCDTLTLLQGDSPSFHPSTGQLVPRMPSVGVLLDQNWIKDPYCTPLVLDVEESRLRCTETRRAFVDADGRSISWSDAGCGYNTPEYCFIKECETVRVVITRRENVCGRPLEWDEALSDLKGSPFVFNTAAEATAALQGDIIMTQKSFAYSTLWKGYLEIGQRASAAIELRSAVEDALGAAVPALHLPALVSLTSQLIGHDGPISGSGPTTAFVPRPWDPYPTVSELLWPWAEVVMYHLMTLSCIYDFTVAIQFVQHAPTSPLSHVKPIEARVQWLDEFAVTAACAADQGLVELPADIVHGILVLQAVMQAWDGVQQIDGANALFVQAELPTQQTTVDLACANALNDAPVELWVNMSQVLETIATALPAAVNDQSRRSSCGCGEEAHVVVASAQAVLAAVESKAILDGGSTPPSSAADAGSLVMALARVHTGLTAVISAAQSGAGAPSGAINDRDATPAATLATLGQTLLAAFSEAVGNIPFVIKPDSQLAAVLAQLRRGVHAAHVVHAMDRVHTFAQQTQHGSDADNTADITGAATELAAALDDMLALGDWHAWFGLHREAAIAAGVAQVPLDAVMSEIATRMSTAFADVSVAQPGVMAYITSTHLREVSDAAALLSTSGFASADGAAAVAGATAVMARFTQRALAFVADVGVRSNMLGERTVIASSLQLVAATALAQAANPYGSAAALSAANLRTQIADALSASTVFAATPIDQGVSHWEDANAMFNHHTARCNTHRRVACPAVAVDACVATYLADGTAAPHCCEAVLAAGYSPASCTDAAACIAAAGAAVVPDECCPTLWANNVSHASCPLLNDCSSIVGDHNTALYTSVVPPELPARCCYDARVQDMTAVHPVCTDLGKRAEQTCPRCALAQLMWHLHDEWNAAGPHHRRLHHVTGLPTFTAAVDGALNAATQASADLTTTINAGSGVPAASALMATNAAHAVGVLERYSGPLAHHQCLIEAGYGDWAHALSFLTTRQVEAIAQLSTKRLMTEADVVGALWAEAQALSVADRRAMFLGATIAFRVAVGIHDNAGVPAEYLPMLAPSHAVQCSRCAPVAGTSFASCTAKRDVQELIESWEAVMPGAASFSSRRLSAAGLFAESLMANADAMASSLAVVATGPTTPATSFLTAVTTPIAATSEAFRDLTSNVPFVPPVDLGIDITVLDIRNTIPMLEAVAAALELVDGSVGGVYVAWSDIVALLQLLQPCRLDGDGIPVGLLGVRRSLSINTQAQRTLISLNAIPLSLHAMVDMFMDVSLGDVVATMWQMVAVLRLSLLVGAHEGATRLAAVHGEVEAHVAVLDAFVGATGSPNTTNVAAWQAFVEGPAATAVTASVSTLTPVLAPLSGAGIAINWLRTAATGIVAAVEQLDIAAALCSAVEVCPDRSHRIRGSLLSERAAAVVAALDAAAGAGDPSMPNVQAAVAALLAVASTFDNILDQELLRSIGVADVLNFAVDEFSDAASAMGWSAATVHGVWTMHDMLSLYLLRQTIETLVTGGLDAISCGGPAAITASAFADEARVARAGIFRDSLGASLTSSGQRLAGRVSMLSQDSPLPVLLQLFDEAAAASTDMDAAGESTALAAELRVRAVQASIGQLCAMAAASDASLVALAPLAGAIDTVAAQPSEAATVSMATAVLPTQVAAAWEDQLVDIARVWAKYGSTALYNTAAASVAIADALQQAPFRASPSCTAGGVEAGSCPAVTSFAVPSAADMLRVACLQLGLIGERLARTLPLHGLPGSTAADFVPLDPALGVDMSMFMSAAAGARYALDALYYDLTVDDVAALVPEAEGLLHELHVLGVCSSFASIQPVLWATNGLPAFFERVDGAATSMSAVASAVAAGVASLSPAELRELTESSSAAVASLKQAAGSNATSPELFVAALRVEIGRALVDDSTGKVVLAPASRATLMSVDALIIDLVVAGALSRLPTAGILTLENALADLVAATRGDVTLRPQLVAMASSLHQGLKLMAATADVSAIQRALSSVDDAAALAAIVAPSSSDGVQGFFAEEAYGRLVQQSVPLVASLTVAVGSASSVVHAMATTAAADLATFAPAVPTLSLGAYAGAKPWLQWHLDSLVHLVNSVSADVGTLRLRLRQLAVDVGADSAVISDGQLAVLMPQVEHEAIHLLLTIKRLLAASQEVSSFAPLPASLVELLAFVEAAFDVRCVVSCSFDVAVHSALHASHTASAFVQHVDSFYNSDSLNSLLTTAGGILADALSSMGVAATDAAAAVGSPAPTATSTTGTSMLKSLADRVDAAVTAGYIVTTGAESADLVAALHELAATAADAPSMFPTTATISLEATVANTLQKLRLATDAGFDVNAVTTAALGRGDTGLADALETLAHYVPVMTHVAAPTAARDSAESVHTAWSALLLHVSVLNDLEDLDGSTVGQQGLSLVAQNLADVLATVADGVHGELAGTSSAAISSTIANFNSAYAAAGGAASFTGSLQAALVEASSATAAVTQRLAEVTAASVPLPTASAADVTQDSVRPYTALASALSTWRSACTSAVHELAAQLGVGATFDNVEAASPIGAALVAAIDAVSLVDDTRVDSGHVDVVSNSVLLAELMSDVHDVAALIHAGADTSVIRREAGEIANELTQRLDEAVLRQVDGAVAPFVAFVSEAQSVFGAGGSGPDPGATAATFASMLEHLEAALAYMSGESVTLLDLMETFDGLATDLHEFPLDVTDEVLDAIDSVRADVQVAREVADTVDTLVDSTIEFTRHAERMAADLPEFVDLVSETVDVRLQNVVDLFQELLHRLDEVDVHVLPANAAVVDRAADLNPRVDTLFTTIDPVPLLDDIQADIDHFRKELIDHPEQDVDEWEDVIELAQELKNVALPYDDGDTLKMGELAHAMTVALTGIELIDRRASTLEALIHASNDIFNRLTALSNATAPVIEALPSESQTRDAFSKIRESSQELSELFASLDSGVSGLLLSMGVQVDDLLALLLGQLDSHDRQQYLLRSQADRVDVSTDGVSTIISRRYRISELSELFRKDSHVPVAAAAVLRRFTDLFLGGLPSEYEFIDSSGSLSGLPPGCGSEFSVVPLDAINALRVAQESLAAVRPSLDVMAGIAAELPGLASVARTQRCVEGATCSVSLIASRMSEAGSLLRSMEAGLAAASDFTARAVDVADAFSDVASCHAALPAAMDFWQDATAQLMSGELLSLTSGTLEQAVQDGLRMTGDVELQAAILDTALAVFRNDNQQAIFAVSSLHDITSLAHAAASEALAWLQSIVPTLAHLNEVHAVLGAHDDFRVTVTSMYTSLEPLFVATEDFVRLPTVRVGTYWADFDASVLDVVAKMKQCRSVLTAKQAALDALLVKLTSTQRPVAMPNPPKPNGLLAHCNDGVCLQLEGRSTRHYRDVVFPGLTTRFWYETIPFGQRDRFVSQPVLTRFYMFT